MDDFFIGRKFSSLDEIQAVMQQYKKEKKVEFAIRDCKSLQNKIFIHLRGRVNQALVYKNLKLCCVRGGRAHYPRGKGCRRSSSIKTGCQAFVTLHITRCGQYLKVNKLCLEHNHELELKPPSRIQARAEIRRRNLMKRMKISYEEAVVLERLKVSARSRLVGPVEVDDLDFNEKSFDSFENCRSERTEAAPGPALKQAVSSIMRNIGEISDTKGQKSDTKVQNKADVSKISTEQLYQIACAPTAKKTSEEVSEEINLSERPASDNEEQHIYDDEDYRRPLVVPATETQTKDDNCYYVTNDIVEESLKEIIDVTPSVQNIFTRKGDDGMSSTFSGMRLYKDDIVFEALGTIEELSNAIGHAKEFLPRNCTDIGGQLVEVQCVLQDMVIHVGTPQSNCSEFQKVNSQFPETHVIRLENLIQVHEGRLPKVNPIILPSGGAGSTGLHVARAICRRAERRVLCLVREGDVDKTVACYLNRLGDYLFVAARIASSHSGKKECSYTQPNFVVRPNLPLNIVKPTLPAFTSANQGYILIYPQNPT